MDPKWMGSFREDTGLTRRPKELFHRKDKKTGRTSNSQVFQSLNVHTVLMDLARIVSPYNLDPHHPVQYPLVAVATEHLEHGSHD